MRYFTPRFSDDEIARLREQAQPVEAATIDAAREKLEQVSTRRRNLRNQIRNAVSDILCDIANDTLPPGSFHMSQYGSGDANRYCYDIGQDRDTTQIDLDYSPEFVCDEDGTNGRMERRLKIQLPGYGYLRAGDTCKVRAAILFGVIAGQINTLQQKLAEQPFDIYDAACEDEISARKRFDQAANAVKVRLDNQRHTDYRSRTVVGQQLEVDTTPPWLNRRVFSPGAVSRVTEKCVYVTMYLSGNTKRYFWDAYLAALDGEKLRFDGEEGKGAAHGK